MSLQRDDRALLRRMLHTVRERSKFPIVFGGEVSGNGLRLTEFSGTTTSGLHGLTVLPGSGAGGLAIAASRLVAVADYRRAASITHEHDRPVVAEGIRAIMAAPIVVNGSTRMVAYVAIRWPISWGNQAREDLMAAVGEVARELIIRDEVDRRIAMRDAAAAEGDLTLAETSAEVATELLEIAGAAEDAAIASRLVSASRRLTEVSSRRKNGMTTLTLRERDVLTLVSYGLTYPEVARELGLAAITVKSYMKDTIMKLGTHNRHQAVVEARMQGLLQPLKIDRDLTSR